MQNRIKFVLYFELKNILIKKLIKSNIEKYNLL